MKKTEIQREALNRATMNESTANYETIISEFIKRGIAAEEIVPRVNVFTFNAWKAKGRTVRKGEHGVKIVTFIPAKASSEENLNENQDKKKKKQQRFMMPRTTTVFHISQTEKL